MRAFARASILAAIPPLLCAIAAHPADAATAVPTVSAAAPGLGASVVIHASDGRPGHIPTYPGPDGARVPAGACAAVQGGRVWILPCNDPRVTAYRRASALAVRQQRRDRLVWRGGGLLAGLAVVATAAVLWLRRHVRPVEVGE